MLIFAVPMTLKLRYALLIALAVIVSSCGIVRLRNSPLYYAGEPVQEGYTPSGTVMEVYHGCSVPGPTYRRMIVYLPPGYTTSGHRRYPVLYLLHGARGQETSWIKKGKVFQITDSLYAAGTAEPMIIVLPNVNQYNDDTDMEGSRLKDAYESFLEIDGKVESAFGHDVVKVVDSLFRTIPDAGHRAIAGLSIGGIQSAVISAYSVDAFGSVGMLSPCFVVAGLPSRYRSATYGRFPQSVRGQFASSAPEYKIFVGDHDLLKPTIDIYHRRLSRMDCPHDYIVLPGAHQWVRYNGHFRLVKRHIMI